MTYDNPKERRKDKLSLLKGHIVLLVIILIAIIFVGYVYIQILISLVEVYLEAGTVSSEESQRELQLFNETDSNLLSSQKLIASANLPLILEASWYSRKYCLGCRADRLMANGEPLDDNAYTCAYNDLPFGTILYLKYMEKETFCIVSDRMGNYHDIDLTLAVFKELEPNLNIGIINIEMEIVDLNSLFKRRDGKPQINKLTNLTL